MKAATRKVGQIKQIALFQSTPPMKAATGTNVEYGEIVEISIHAAHEGGDSDR